METASEAIASRPVKSTSSFDPADYQNVLKREHEKGFLEGFKEAREEARVAAARESARESARKIASKMLARAAPIEDILYYTGLSLEELKALKKPADK